MAELGLGGKIFCLLMIGVGVGTAAWSVNDAATGLRLQTSGMPVEARITGKHIDKPTSRKPVRWNSTTVNGVTVRSFRTYLYDYMLTVTYTRDGQEYSAIAPVGYDRWHAESIGSVVTVDAAPGITEYVDAAERGTLIYGLRHIAIGLAIALLGGFVLRVSDD